MIGEMVFIDNKEFFVIKEYDTLVVVEDRLTSKLQLPMGLFYPHFIVSKDRLTK